MIGYFTKYGDGASDFEPIQHLYKTEVYELAKFLSVPSSILDAKPSAGLWEGQTDEGELGMNYDELEMILRLKPQYSTEGKIGHVNELIEKSEHKKRIPYSLERVE